MEHTVMEICIYNDSTHRSQVIALWKSVFNYTDARNSPDLSIDCKLAVNDTLFFVAISDGQVVGTVMTGYDGHRGWIYSLAVAPLKRHHKIGTALLTHAENALQKRGCVKVNLQILSSNEAVTDFYIKNGYKVEPRISMGKELRNF
jgi:ribosomal protein S18 acetylase RimI-like enzyme